MQLSTLALLALAGIAGCAGSGPAKPTPLAVRDSAVYVVRLGQDTSYIQWLVRDGRDVRMHVVERIPRVRVVYTMLTQNADGSVARLQQRVYLPPPADTTPVAVTDVQAVGDSTIMVTGSPRAPRRTASPGRSHGMLGPFLMVS
jgi:hypothetical protein